MVLRGIHVIVCHKYRSIWIFFFWIWFKMTKLISHMYTNIKYIVFSYNSSCIVSLKKIFPRPPYKKKTIEIMRRRDIFFQVILPLCIYFDYLGIGPLSFEKQHNRCIYNNKNEQYRCYAASKGMRIMESCEPTNSNLPCTLMLVQRYRSMQHLDSYSNL